MTSDRTGLRARTTRRIAPAALVIAALLAGSAWAGTVDMRWDPVGDSDLAGYRVYYGTDPGSLTQSKDVGLATSTQLTGLDNCTVWYASVRAYDEGGLESPADSNLVEGYPRPVVSNVSPSRIEQGQTLTLTVSGTNFDRGKVFDPTHPAATVELSHAGLSVESVQVDTCGSLRVTVRAAASAAPGFSSLTVKNPDLTNADPRVAPWVYGTMLNAVEVIEEAPPEDTTPPTVAATNPAAGASDVALSVRPTVTFSEALDPASVTSAAVRLLDASGNALAQASGWPTVSGSVVTLRPSSPLDAGETYRIWVRGGSSGVKDLAGNPLASNWTQTPGFTTLEPEPGSDPGDQPEMQSSLPPAGDQQVNLGLASTSMTFDRDMSPLASVLSESQLQASFGLRSGTRPVKQRAGSPVFTNQGRTVVMTYEKPLRAGTSYRHVVDLTGKKLRRALESAGHANLAMSSPYLAEPWTTESGLERTSFREPETGDLVVLQMAREGAVPQDNSGVPCEADFRLRFALPVLESSLEEDSVRLFSMEPGRILPKRIELMEPPRLIDGGRTILLTPAEPLNPGRLHWIGFGILRTGIQLDSEVGPIELERARDLRVFFYTEMSADPQSGSLGVAP